MDEVLQIKKDINISMEYISDNPSFKSLLGCIFKKIFLFKYLSNSLKSKLKKEYMDNCINDSMMTLISINNNNIKTVKMWERSFIENIVRFVIDFQDSNDLGILKTFNHLKNKINKDDYAYIYGEYGKCCDYVHSNKNIQITLYNTFGSIKKSELKEQEIKMILENIKTLFIFTEKILADFYPEEILNAFFLNDLMCKYLLSEKNYQLIEKYKINRVK